MLATVMLAVSLSLTPSDDVWVYGHASDPGGDAYLRVWGSGGDAVSPSPSDSANFSYGYLRFDLSTLGRGKQIKSATLTVFVPDGAEADPNRPPLQARSLSKGFLQKGFSYGDLIQVHPLSGPSAIFGEGTLRASAGSIGIDLLKGPNDFRKAAAGPEWCVALTSKVSPEEGGMKDVYKIFSREAENPLKRPSLTIELE